MSKSKYRKSSSLSATMAEYLSLGIPLLGVELESAARDTFPAFPLNGSEDAMLTAIKLKVDELEKVVRGYERDGVWSNQVEEAVRQGIEATCIGLCILDRKQAVLAALEKASKMTSRRERRNGTSTRTRLS